MYNGGKFARIVLIILLYKFNMPANILYKKRMQHNSVIVGIDQ